MSSSSEDEQEIAVEKIEPRDFKPIMKLVVENGLNDTIRNLAKKQSKNKPLKIVDKESKLFQDISDYVVSSDSDSDIYKPKSVGKKKKESRDSVEMVIKSVISRLPKSRKVYLKDFYKAAKRAKIDSDVIVNIEKRMNCLQK
ncbi:hypothetical protein HDV01_007540 [Terramyces sp. JEL0728]|nr:hypothetical protein HDV01_007540 [Terramyces sp. JEL0728]